jgi:hypothetical protein
MSRKALLAALLLVCAAPLSRAAGLRYLDVEATYLPPSGSGRGALVAVSFLPREAEIRVNEAPRLSLDPLQAVLVERGPSRAASSAANGNSEGARYVDPLVPVTFPVALAPKAPRGTHAVKATVTYFYCSKREGWCRKGASEVELQVKVP